MNKFTLVINAGRSGSTFLAELLKNNYRETVYTSHEDIPVQISKPRCFNRAYSQDRLNEVYSDEKLKVYLDKWVQILQTRSIVETGWTSYHLCPVLHDLFGDDFRVIMMHRDPISYAFSRANMGNYHDRTFYCDSHEVSPFDQHSIAPNKKHVWSKMNSYERCMYWWWVVYLEAVEFHEMFPNVSFLNIRSSDVFDLTAMDSLLKFLELDPSKLKKTSVEKNAVSKFMRETFPISDVWEKYSQHQDILNFAHNIGGYEFNYDRIAELSKKYQLPKGIMPYIRHKSYYWLYKSKIKALLLG